MYEKVSIIIPVWNCEKYLRECLDSVTKQTYRNLEIILINDGSTDNSLAIMNEYASNDERIIVISQENAGPGAARNVGLEKATGKYFSFIDSDDYVSVDFIAKLKSILKDDCLYSYCGVNVKGKDTFTTPEENSLFIRQACFNRLYNAKFIKDIRFSNDKFGEDLIFNYKLSFESNNIAYTKEPLYFYRTNEGSISNNWSDKYMDLFDAIDKMINYKDLSLLDDGSKERLEFALIWYCILGNFKRAEKNISKDYVIKSVNYIERYFPEWFENKYIEKHIWDKQVINYLVNKDYDAVVDFYIN